MFRPSRNLRVIALSRSLLWISQFATACELVRVLYIFRDIYMCLPR